MKSYERLRSEHDILNTGDTHSACNPAASRTQGTPLENKCRRLLKSPAPVNPLTCSHSMMPSDRTLNLIDFNTRSPQSKL